MALSATLHRKGARSRYGEWPCVSAIEIITSIVFNVVFLVALNGTIWHFFRDFQRLYTNGLGFRAAGRLAEYRRGVMKRDDTMRKA